MANSSSSTAALQIDIYVLRLSESIESWLWYEIRLQLPQEFSLKGLYLAVGLWFSKEDPSYTSNDITYSTHRKI